MRILVFSDSHGRYQSMLDAVEVYRPQAVFHLGDVVRDGEKLAQAYPSLPLYQVQGNCDLGRADCETEGIARLEGKTIFYLHGHTRQVKLGSGPAVAAAQAVRADILLFGLTHVPLQTNYGGLFVLNPGAALDGRCALLTWDGAGEITCLPIQR